MHPIQKAVEAIVEETRNFRRLICLFIVNGSIVKIRRSDERGNSDDAGNSKQRKDAEDAKRKDGMRFIMAQSQVCHRERSAVVGCS